MAHTKAPARLIWSNLSAQCSEQIALAASPIVVVVVLNGGAVETGWVQLIQTLPFLLLSLPMGVLADRYSRKRLMIASEMLRAITACVLVVALALNVLSVPILAMLGFLGAVGTLGFSIAGPALLPSIVAKHELAAVNRGLELARSVAFVAGPPIAGALVAWTGASLAFATALVASAMSAALILPLREPPVLPKSERHIGRDLAEGFHFVLRHQHLRPIALTAMMFNIGWFMLQTVLVVFLIDHLGSDAVTVGVLFGLYGFGMIAGALAASSLARSFSLGSLIVVGPAFGFLGSLLVLVAWLAQGQAWIGLALFCFGFGPILWSINTTSLRQVVTPPTIMGRATALLTLATSGARPIGAGLGIFVVSSMGMEACLVGSALCFAVQLLIILRSATARLMSLPMQTSSNVA